MMGSPLIELNYLPDDVRRYLAALQRALLTALGTDEVIQICLVGSASYPSGFIPGRSDLDVTVVTRSSLDESILARVPEKCSHAILPCPAEKLELVVYNYGAVHLERTVIPYDVSLNYNTGSALPLDHIRYGNNPDDSPHWFILDIAAAHANNVALLDGPSFSDIFTPRLARQEVLAALHTSLQWHIRYEPTSTNAVLNACRGWRWSVQGIFGSKLEGGQFALSRLSGEPAQAVQTALMSRTGTGSGVVSRGEAESLYNLIAAALQGAERNNKSLQSADGANG
jgi:hypothetical protein